MKLSLCAASLLAAAATPALAAPPPEGVRAMIDAALSTGDPTTIAAVINTAKQAAPDSRAEIEAMADDYNARLAGLQLLGPPVEPEPLPQAQAEAPPDLPPVVEPPVIEKIKKPGLFSLWRGDVELGGSRSTGNSDTLGVYGGGTLTRIDGDWTQKLTARVDYEEDAGDATTERALAAYQPQKKLGRVVYAYGLAQYEHDRFAGYRHRYTTGTGLGLSAVSRWDLRFDLDVGPAVRYTSFYDRPDETQLVGRGAFSIKWFPSKSLTLTQDTAVYVDDQNTSARSTTSVDTRLIGPLKARLSYNVQYERDAPDPQKQVDTTSRATLVYSF